MRFPLHPRLDLNGDWTLQLAPDSGPIAARVPGNFELDLLRDGQIEEPFEGMNIAELQRFERCHLYYSRTFDYQPRAGCQPILRFEGADCIAEYFLNGRKFGESDNALIEHEFAVAEFLQVGQNELMVHFSPALESAEKFDYPPFVGAQKANYEALYLRKPPHCFGWDIMPRALSAGLWRGVSLVFRPGVRLEMVHLRTIRADARRAQLLLHFEAQLDANANYEIEVEGVCGESRFFKRERALSRAGRLKIEIENPLLWWPKNRGDANLYRVTVRLLRDGREVDRAEFAHGVRTLELDRTSTTDSRGNGEFCFRVNGEKIFVLGTNWVPLDAYHSRDAPRLPTALELLDEIGCNMVRCWGGNVYESDDFFDWCDCNGVLVWQDFALACAVYPQDAAFQARIKAEAVKVVRRLREHACLALWAGDNECDQAYEWFGAGDPNHNVLTRQILPAVVREQAPGALFLPSSPFIDETAFAAGETYLPENHLWGPRDGFKSDFYRNSLCHFASEIGYHGCPSRASIEKFIAPEQLWPPDNEQWILHASSPVPGVDLYDYRVELMRKQIREFFGSVPDNLDDFAFQSQCVQAEAKKFFIELFRTQKWRRTGIIWWNLLDGWPQFSDAVVDYYGAKKLAFDFIKRAQQPLLLTLREAENWQHEIVACNDTRADLEIEFRIWDAQTGETVSEGRGVAASDAVTILDAIPASAADKRFYLIEWSGAAQGRNHYLSGLAPFDAADYARWLQTV